MLRTRISSLLLPALLVTSVGCEFEPRARRAQPRLVAVGATQVLGALDAVGAYVLLQEQAEGGPRSVIADWQHHARCELPAALEGTSRPLARPSGAPRRSARFWLPLLLREEERTQLLLVDERCAAHSPAHAAEPDSLRTFFSQEDGRGLLVFQDGSETLLFDPFRLAGPTPLAGPVQEVRPARPIAGGKLDALWLLEDGLLTQRDLSGELRVALGEAVSAFALAPDGKSVAYVDGGALYEAGAPHFEPEQVATDACLPRYADGALDFFSPCEEQALRRREPQSEELRTFGPGVFASVTEEGVHLDYVRQDETTIELYAASPRYARRRVEPPLEPQHTYVLDARRLAGLSTQGDFGSWDGVEGRFRELLRGADTVLPHFRGKKHEHWWLVRHDVEGELGAVSVLNERDLSPLRVADGVPAPRRGVLFMERGGGLPNYPFAEPIVFALAEAVPLAADPLRFKGRLRALLLSGEPSAELAADVSSYQLVAVPIPGVLYGVEEGPDAGLWFVGL